MLIEGVVLLGRQGNIGLLLIAPPVVGLTALLVI